VIHVAPNSGVLVKIEEHLHLDHRVQKSIFKVPSLGDGV